MPPARAAYHTMHHAHPLVEVVAPWPVLSAASFAFLPVQLTPARTSRFSGFVSMLVARMVAVPAGICVSSHLLSSSSFCACSRCCIQQLCFVASLLSISEGALSRLCIVRNRMRLSYVVGICNLSTTYVALHTPSLLNLVWGRDDLLRQL